MRTRVALHLLESRKFGQFRYQRDVARQIGIVIVMVAFLLAGLFLALTSFAAEASAQGGYASFYNDEGYTASGDYVVNGDWTAAHPWWPFGSEITVCYAGTCVHNVVINDRGPYAGGRSLDLHSAPAEELGLTYAGVDYVKFRRERAGHWDGVYTSPSGVKWLEYGY